MVEAINSNSCLTEGTYAPDFTLDTDNGKSIVLSELKGKNVVMYFYPKDDTTGCTNEAIDFSSLICEFENYNTVVIGISKDLIEKHKKFREKYNLSVVLASDVEGTVCEAYDVLIEKTMYGRKYMGNSRDTFLIDKNGVIKKIWRSVKVKGHAEEVLAAAKVLN